MSIEKTYILLEVLKSLIPLLFFVLLPVLSFYVFKKLHDIERHLQINQHRQNGSVLLLFVLHLGYTLDVDETNQEDSEEYPRMPEIKHEEKLILLPEQTMTEKGFDYEFACFVYSIGQIVLATGNSKIINIPVTMPVVQMELKEIEQAIWRTGLAIVNCLRLSYNGEMIEEIIAKRLQYYKELEEKNNDNKETDRETEEERPRGS